jgi:hypothetical protein
VRCQKCGRPSASQVCVFCRVAEAREKLPEWRTVLQDGEWTVLQNWHLTSWYKVLRNGEIFAEVQVNADFPDENTMQETVTIRRQNRTTVLRRTNPAAPAALNSAELLRLVQEVNRQ